MHGDLALAQLGHQLERIVAGVHPVADQLDLATRTGALTGCGQAQRGSQIAVVVLGQLFELLTLVGYYETLALQLRVFRVSAPSP